MACIRSRSGAPCRAAGVGRDCAALVALVAALILFAVSPAQAAGTPDLQLSGGPATSVLYGDAVAVDLTASLPANAPKGYNLAFRAVLPAGTHYVPGSAGTLDGEPRILADAPTAGKTTLLWDDVDDLVASSSHTLSFSVAYNDTSSTVAPRYDVGDVLPIDTGAYISTQPRDETDWSTTGVAVGPGPGTYTGKGEQSSSTTLTAIEVSKSEPHPEGEIPRGLHDHQTVYTLDIKNNAVNPTDGVSLEDFLPAGLEFLGCAGSADHTTSAPTNPGSTQEYPGSGAITVAHPTAAEHCVQPDLVETVNGDPDGSGPLGAGVYTHVKWNDVGDFAAGATRTLTYAAAIPIRENTTAWTGVEPDLTGGQTANLDNNSGPETYDEQPLRNGAVVAGTYLAPAKAGKAVSDEGTLLRTAEDIAIQKSDDNGGLEQGDLTKWTVDLQVSEYRSVDDITIHDVVPNGLCPLGAVNEEHAPPATQVECDPVTGKSPSDPYASVAEQADGTYDVTWDKTSMPSLAHVKPSETRQLTFWTRTRDHYQSSFQDAAPILSKDSVTNQVDTTGTDWVRCTGATPDCVTAAGAKIAHDEADGEPDTDVSGAGKVAAGPILEKQVAAAYPASGDCGDLVAAAYGKTVPVYGPGDEVCWKLRLAFPSRLNTTSQDVFDILPSGLTYVPGSARTTSANSLPVGAVDTSTDGRLRWPIGDANDVDRGGQVFEVTFKSTVGSPLGHRSGDVEGNLMKFSYANTAGTAFPLRDRTDFALKVPELSLVKGVRQINGTGTVYGPNADHKQVQGADSVEYRVDVTNGGTADASSSRIWDLLPAGIDCADVQLGSISDGGACNTLARRIEWPSVPVAHGATRMLTYKVTVPTGVSPDVTFVNTAGVVEVTYTTNAGTPYELIPANDVVKDPSLPPANAPQAQDVSDVFTPASTIVKQRSTSVGEAGNDATTQATIGETVNFTVTTTIPHGTTLYGTPTVVDDLGTRQAYVPGTLTATLNGAALPAAGVSAAASANVITATFPATYANPTGDDVLVLTFNATVLDADSNTRGTNLPNTATLTFSDEQSRTVTHSSTVQTTIAEPKVALAKSHTPSGRVSPSQVVSFTVKASNQSATNVSTAHDVVVVDTLPAGTDPIDAAGNPIADGAGVPAEGGIWNLSTRTITWNTTTTPALAAIAPGAFKNLTYRTVLESAPVSGQTYTNVAGETAKSLDRSIAGGRTSAATSTTAPDYKAQAQDVLSVVLPAVTKDVTPDQVTTGNKVVWHVHVTLPKNVRYYDATVVDTVPDGFDVDGYGPIACVSGCPAGDPAVSSLPVTSPGSGKLQAAWYLGDVPPSATDRVYDLVLNGHVRDTYRSGAAKVLDGQTLVNSVSVKTDRTNKVSGTPAGVPATFDDTAGPAIATNHVVEPKLTLDKNADTGPFVEGGDHVGYTVKVKNTGTAAAYDVVVDDQPDSELENVQLAGGVSTTLNTDGWTAGDPHMRWVIPGPVAAGDTVTVSYSADVKAATSLHAGDQIANTAAVVENYAVPKATRDADGFIYRRYTGPPSTVVLTVALPDLSIVKTPDHGAATAGSPSSFTIKVANADPHATAHGVVVHDVLQSGLTYTAGAATASPAAGFGETGASGQQIDWRISSLAPGATVTITVPVAVAGGVPNATTLLNSATTHATEVPTDKTDTGSLDVVARTDLQVTKASDHDPVVPGTNVVYTITVTSNGPSDALASTLSDTLPSYLSLVSLDDTTHCAASGQVVTCGFGTLARGDTRTVHLTARLDPSRTTPIANAADVTTTTTETDPSNNHAQAPNTVKPTADVSIRKTADGTLYEGGDVVTYSLVAHNDGPSTAQGVTIDDDIPSQLTFASVTPGAPACSQSAAHVHCDLGALAPGADRTVTLVTTARGAPPAPAPGASSHKITVSKSEQAQSLQAGETSTWDVTCDANGIAADGSVEVMHVDQGTGSSADVEVIEAHSIALGTYRFTARNPTSGQAQVKLFVTCLPHDTDPDAHTHPLDVGALQTLSTGSLQPGRYSFTLPTSAAHRAAAPGIEVLSGRARLGGGEPDANGWRFTVEVLEAAQLNLSIRALNDYTGPGGDPAHVHGFTFQHVVRTASLPAGESVQRVECPVGYKGIVATYDLPDGVVSLGNEPQPIDRDFRLLNTTDHSIDAMLDLECISIDVGPPVVVEPVVNTATVAATTFDPSLANDTDGVTIGVERAPGPLDAAPAPVLPAPAAPRPLSAPASGDPSVPAAPGAAAPPPPVPAGRSAALRFGTVSVASSGARAVVPVTCSAASACHGTVTLRAPAPSSWRTISSAKPRTVVLGRAPYSAKAGKTVRVGVKIAKRYRTMLRSGVRRVSIASGGTTTTKNVVVLRRKAEKRA